LGSSQALAEFLFLIIFHPALAEHLWAKAGWKNKKSYSAKAFVLKKLIH